MLWPVVAWPASPGAPQPFRALPPPPATPVSAPGFFRLDAGAWGFEPEGSARFGGSTVDFQRDLDLQAGRRAVLRAEWAENLADTAHPWYLPVQVSADYVATTFDGRQVIQPTTLLRLGPIVITQGGTTVFTDTRFRDAGAVVGWQLWRFQPGARLEGGVALKNVRAEIDVVDPSQNQRVRQEANLTFPLASLAITAGRGRVRLRADGQYGQLSGGRAALNAEALVNWQPPGLGPLGLEAGWRYRRYRFRDEGNSGDAFDLRLSGWRLGARLEFGPAPRP